MMKPLICLILTLMMTLPPPVVRADAVDEAKAYVAKSQDAAREVARLLFQEHLWEFNTDLNQTLSETQAAALETQTLSKTLSDLEIDLADLGNMSSIDHESFRENFRVLANDLYDKYTTARTREEVRDHIFIRGQAATERAKESIFHSIKKLEKMCQRGIGSSRLENYSLPPKLFLPTPYEVNVSVSTNDDGTLRPGFGGTSGKNQARAELIAAINTLAVAVGNATGHVYLGAAVGAIISTIVYFVDREEALKEAEKIAEANYIVFSEKANSRDIQKYYREMCKQHVPAFSEAAQYAENISRGKESEDRLDSLRRDVAETLNKVASLQMAYNKKAQELLMTYKDFTPEEKQKRLADELSKSEEGKALNTFFKALSPSKVQNIMYVSIVELSLSIQDYSDFLEGMEEKIFQNKTEGLLPQVLVFVSMARRLNMERVNPGVLHLINQELRRNQEIGELYREFDRLLARYVREFFMTGSGRGVLAEYKVWNLQRLRLNEEFPDSPALSKIARESELTFGTLGGVIQ